MSVPVTVYTTNYCPYCTRAIALLKKKGVSYQEIDVTGNDEQRKYLVSATGRRTVPQIFIDGKPIGGCDDLYALEQAGTLDAMLSPA